jgi:mannose-6-phosphate isomerase-like protein (cupin superfamily)
MNKNIFAEQIPITYDFNSMFAEVLNGYSSNYIFSSTGAFVTDGNPYRRPIRPQDIAALDFHQPLARQDITGPSALTAQRILLNIYESDLIFLPGKNFEKVASDFSAFYADDLKVCGEILRPTIERHLFAFLNDEIEITGTWTPEKLRYFCESRIESIRVGNSALSQAIHAARDPKAATRLFLVQCAGDFLTEASAMGRNLLGSYGQELSELFKIFIDEYGYGVYSAKHSTIFERLLESVNMSPQAHYYWQFYLASSIGLVTYFHHVSRNHRLFFRYLGALYFTEATLAHTTATMSKMLRDVFGDDVDTRYFDEHHHIDVHHGSMAIDRIIEPIMTKCGAAVIPEILRGFEEFRMLQDIADEDLISQISWSDDLKAALASARLLLPQTQSQAYRECSQTFHEESGELSVSHTHAVDELLVVEEGVLELVGSPDKSIVLQAGEGIVIPRHRLHGSVVRSDTCTYTVCALKDIQQ